MLDLERLETMHYNLMNYDMEQRTDWELLEQTTLYLAELIRMLIDERRDES